LQNQPDNYETQIDEIVHGFMQVWIKFEAMLPAELARVQGLLDGMSPEKALSRDSDYEVFYRVSSVLSQKNNVMMGELSAALSIPLSKATRIADWLIAHEYIARIPDTDDRRIVRIALTQKGLILHRAVEDNIRRRVKEILSSLTVEEREALFKLVGKVVNSLINIES
jgi:DNA-binding MarR family transcriptional regulator